MRGPSPAATSTANDHAERPIAGEAGPCRSARVGTAIVAGHDLDVLVTRAPVAILVLDARVREMHLLVVVRQVVLARPQRDLLRLAIWSAVAVLPTAIVLLKEPLVVPLELVVQDDATDSRALFAEALLDALVGAIDARIVRELTRLSQAFVKGLAGLVAAVFAVVAVGLEQGPPAVC